MMESVRRYMRGEQCPECGNVETSTICDNGGEGYDVVWLCEKCGNQWDATQIAYAHGQDGWDEFEDVFQVVVLEDRVVHMPRAEYDRGLEGRHGW